MHTSDGIEVKVFGGLLLFAAMTVMALAGIAEVTGFTFWEVADHARALLFGPVLLLIVWVIEKFEVPLPIRLENTWPIILGAVWIGIHTLIVMKAESEVTVGMGLGEYYSDGWVDLPWYAGKACLFLVFAGIVIAGYVVRSKRNRNYW